MPTSEREVIEQSHQTPVVVDFWAPWCQPCLMLAPLLERLVAEPQRAVLLAKVNIDESQQMAARLGVESIPAVKAFRDGHIVMEFVGLYPESAREFLDRLMPSEADRAVKEADALVTTDPTRAEALYRQALATEHSHPGRFSAWPGCWATAATRTGRPNCLSGSVTHPKQIGCGPRRAAVAGARFESEATLRQKLLSDPENAELHYELGACWPLRANINKPWSPASPPRTGPHLATSRVKEAMVKVFQVVGVRSELADEYRRKLTRLLY
jgi:putative thioredoxin